MSKILQIVIYKSINDDEKLAAYAKLSAPAMQAQGGRVIARGMPVAVAEEGEATRTVVIEWDSLEQAQAAYKSEGYQEALAALDGSATREFRYIEMV